MKIPQLKKKPEIKKCHNKTWEDNYSWIHQDDILEVLKDSKKLNPEVKRYLEEENSYTDFYLSKTKNIQKKLFDEIKGRIKLDDESLPFKDYNYEYWTKTTAKGNYSIKLRKMMGSNDIQEMYKVFGIEVARQCIYNEFTEVMLEGGLPNDHHLSLLCDRMTYSYKMISIFRHGINNDDIGPLAKASFGWNIP